MTIVRGVQPTDSLPLFCSQRRRVVASQLLTKYVNLMFPVDRGAYEQLPALVLTVTVSAVVLPLAVVLGLRRRFSTAAPMP